MSQQGQTLIETLVAAFILVMGISAALGLANYSLGATSGIRQQTMALGLAREGIEVVKNMRDTNWLRGTLSNDCYDFLPGSTTPAYCYHDWLNASGGFNIDPNGPTTYSLSFNPAASDNKPWSLSPATSYGLNLSTNLAQTGIRYTPSVSAHGNSGFYRKITLEEETDFTPFNRDVGGRLKVTSQVWWTDRNKCPARANISEGESCSVTLVTYLTNWRNF